MTNKFSIAKQLKGYFRNREVPLWFRILNLAILLPVLLWPLVFFATIFFFDNPKNLFLTFLLFLAVNAYPIYLLLIMLVNVKLYSKNKYAALVLPLIVIVTVGGGSIYTSWLIRKNTAFAEEVERKRIESGDLGSGFRKDKIHVYRNDTVIADADPETFDVISWQWERDSKHYFYHGKLVPYIDRLTFQDLDYHYGKDKNNVYYDDKIIEGADANSFQHFEGTQDGRDKNNCYRYGEKVDCSELEKEE